MHLFFISALLLPTGSAFLSPSNFGNPRLSVSHRFATPPAEDVNDYRSQIPDNRDGDESLDTDTGFSNSVASTSSGASLTPQAKLAQQIRVSMKFGGSSLADSSRIDHVANLIKDQMALGYFPQAVVCSAMGKTTNNLLNAGEFALDGGQSGAGGKGKVNIDPVRTLVMNTLKDFEMENMSVLEEVEGLLQECEDMLRGVKLLQELSPRSLDTLVSFGERISVRVMAARLNQIGVPAVAFDSWEVGMQTSSEFGDATILPETSSRIRRTFENKIDPNTVAVVTGFIAQDSQGRITTLGRGGSDLTATAIGAACGLDEVQVWKDVDGIMSCDPRMVKNAVPIEKVSFEEASELAYFGAKVLHPIAMQPAMLKQIPVRVKNSYNPAHPGTVIQYRDDERLVTAITCKRDVQLIDIKSTRMLGAYGFLANVFSAFERNKLSVDVLASSEVSVSLTLDKKHHIDTQKHPLLSELKEVSKLTVKENMSIITLIADVERSSEVLAKVFSIFMNEDIKVEMLSQGASKVNISLIVSDKDLVRAIMSMHKEFFEKEEDQNSGSSSGSGSKKETKAEATATALGSAKKNNYF